MRRLYVETSALLRVLLEGDQTLPPLLSGESLFTSALTCVEASRAVARAVRDGRLTSQQGREVGRRIAAFERACDLLDVGEDVLRYARGEFPVEPVRTLDALHLSSIRVLDEALGGFEVVSCDERIRKNAVALGYAVHPSSPTP